MNFLLLVIEKSWPVKQSSGVIFSIRSGLHQSLSMPVVYLLHYVL